METQWPLVIFTLFVCISCGLVGAESVLLLKGKGKKIMFPTLIASAVALVIGGLGSFTHLQHWERIFNGFGHITSGITQELIGCVLMGIIMVIWFAFWYRKKEISKGVAIASLVVSAAMVIATAHSYLMPARPAWTLLIVYYLGNAILLGTAGLWLISCLVKESELAPTGAKMALWGGVIGLVTMVIYAISLAVLNVWDFGYYADPTAMTTAPTHVSSLIGVAVSGSGAGFFWVGIVTAVLVIACACLSRKDASKGKIMSIVGVVCALATSVCFRIVIYIVAYTMYLMF